MSKYSPGDVVKVKADLVSKQIYGGVDFIRPMGETRFVTIKECTGLSGAGSDTYTVEENEFTYTDEMLGAVVCQVREEPAMTTFSTGAVRDIAVDKPEMDLIPWDLMDRVAKHYGKGVKKYGKNNWRLGQKKSHTFASLIRHAMAYWAGKTDEDHLSAIIWNAFSLMWVDTQFQDNDDLNDLEGFQ